MQQKDDKISKYYYIILIHMIVTNGLYIGLPEKKIDFVIALLSN